LQKLLIEVVRHWESGLKGMESWFQTFGGYFLSVLFSHITLFWLFSSKQRDLYDETFRDLVQAVLDGFNGTIFAYGQTGTGKTFTMQGNSLLLLYKCLKLLFRLLRIVIHCCHKNEIILKAASPLYGDW